MPPWKHLLTANRPRLFGGASCTVAPVSQVGAGTPNCSAKPPAAQSGASRGQEEPSSRLGTSEALWGELSGMSSHLGCVDRGGLASEASVAWGFAEEGARTRSDARLRKGARGRPPDRAPSRVDPL